MATYTYLFSTAPTVEERFRRRQTRGLLQGVACTDQAKVPRTDQAEVPRYALWR